MAAVMSASEWVEDFDRLVAALGELPLAEVQRRCVLGRSKLDAAEVRRLAAEIGADGDDTRARRRARAGGARSKASARKAAARAAAVAKNRTLGDDLASGDLSEEKLDTIADAASDDSSAATDQDFIDRIKKSSVDAGKKLSKERKNRKRDESFHERQRRMRSARRWEEPASGLAAITLRGDDATVQEIWNTVLQREKQLREQDGGREVPRGQHPRTREQRLFDAFAGVVLNKPGSGGVMARPSTMLLVPVDGSDPHIAGGSPVTDDYARKLLERAELSIMLIDATTSRPLWLGRTARNATTSQYLALVARDGGCVMCGANWVTCEAHHTIPWHSPARGETDLDNLALVCTDCHHHIHQANLTLTQQSNNTWTTRPATPNETPVQRHHRRPDRRGQSGKPNPAAQSARTTAAPRRTHRPSTTGKRTLMFGSSNDGDDPA
ncbi:MAG: HNH endonuclease signature motif containing protein [Actinomycetota bacterium]